MPKEFHRVLFFSKNPLNGFYKYQDIFQIFPCSAENIPASSHVKHYPNFLEFWTDENDHVYVESEYEELIELKSLAAKIKTKQDKIFNLLNSFLNNLFFQYPTLEGFWGIPIIENATDAEINTWSSTWCLNIFHSSKWDNIFRIESFSKQEINPIPRMPHMNFYTLNPHLDRGLRESIFLPQSIDDLLDCYYKLDKVTQSVIDSASSFTVAAVELMDEKKTVSLLCSFTSLETMVNLEYKDHKPEICKNCSQSKFKVAYKFREYLLKYIGGSSDNRSKFNAYYSLRSKIVHKGELLSTEQLFNTVSRKDKSKELITRIEILQLGKLSIVNWLLQNSPNKLANYEL